jgi:hypothetical protein
MNKRFGEISMDYCLRFLERDGYRNIGKNAKSLIIKHTGNMKVSSLAVRTAQH